MVVCTKLGMSARLARPPIDTLVNGDRMHAHSIGVRRETIRQAKRAHTHERRGSRCTARACGGANARRANAGNSAHTIAGGHVSTASKPNQ